MEIISIEMDLLDSLLANLNDLADTAERLCRAQDYSMEKWMDNEDVCVLLDISKRTLQTYRDSGKITFSQIEQKMYYKPQDVAAFVEATRFQNKFPQYEKHIAK